MSYVVQSYDRTGRQLLGSDGTMLCYDLRTLRGVRNRIWRRGVAGWHRFAVTLKVFSQPYSSRYNDATKPCNFAHTTQEVPPTPDEIVGVCLLDERPGVTGVYYRTTSGGLHPCVTIIQADPDQHTAACEPWLCLEGIHEDKRSVR